MHFLLFLFLVSEFLNYIGRYQRGFKSISNTYFYEFFINRSTLKTPLLKGYEAVSSCFFNVLYILSSYPYDKLSVKETRKSYADRGLSSGENKALAQSYVAVY